MFLSVLSPRFSVALDPRGRLGAWKGRLGVVVRNLRAVRVVCCAKISESSSPGSPGLSRIKGH